MYVTLASVRVAVACLASSLAASNFCECSMAYKTDIEKKKKL